ncbi:Potassium voltage-gated channel subfamily KQT member 1 [Sarcoptes scabiei]|uniref:Ion channel-like protein n=1 Tax=Sarcoptes scabiei TaxID=52283 RepID=A0A131ZVU5_SARSC|nr:Potassium voltage-gated channel subfamily KQT member 1 [Sarcoptes scabiei]KPM02854.1 ion channel-like protein [Sarcoptes scabiei]
MSSSEEITIKSISELNVKNIFPIQRGSLNAIRTRKEDLSQQDDLIRKIVHPLIRLPEQIDIHTDVRLKKISKKPQDRVHRIRETIYSFLNHPTFLCSYIYHGLCGYFFIIYFGYLIFTERNTWLQECNVRSTRNVVGTTLERILLIHFCLEFGLRLWCSKAQIEYSRLSTVRWLRCYFCRKAHLFDLVLIINGLFSVICLIPIANLDFTQETYALITIRGFHRLFSAIQWTSTQSRESPWTILREVFIDGGRLLISMFNLVILFIFLMAYGLYIAETYLDESDGRNATINNLLDAIYASSVTFLTIGYGDLYPVTYAGQALVGFGIWLALALFALPTNLIATSVALKVTEQENRRKIKIRKTLAAILIQRAWRLYRRQRQFDLTISINNQCFLSPIRYKIHPTFWIKIKHIIMNRRKYFASKFIQLLLLRLAQRKLRQFNQSTTLRRMKSTENQISTNIEILNQTLKRIESMKNSFREFSSKKSDLDSLQSKLESMNEIVQKQNQILKDLICFEYRRKN